MRLALGDALVKLKKLDENSVDALVTDPPAGIAFMGKDWDDFRRAHNSADVDRPNVFGRTSRVGPEYARGDRNRFIEWLSQILCEARRVLKPGAYALVWSIPRTSHWTATAIENAGFEIRDIILHLFGTGFPKSLNVGKAIDKRGGNVHLTEQIGKALKKARISRKISASQADKMFCDGTTNWSWFEGRPAGQRSPSPETFSKICKEWPELKPISEMVKEAEREIVGQRLTGIGTGKGNTPIMGDGNRDVTISATQNAKKWDGWGTALKPAAEHWILARAPLSEKTVAANVLKWGTGAINIDESRIETPKGDHKGKGGGGVAEHWQGKDIKNKVYGDQYKRTPPDHTQGRFPTNVLFDEEAGKMLDAQGGERQGTIPHILNSKDKASQRSKNKGWGTVTARKNAIAGFGDSGGASRFFYCPKASRGERGEGNDHPTVKALVLMEYLIRLITPPKGIVLDPFMGSGSTGIAARRAGFDFIGIEKDPHYFEIAKKRLGK